MRLRIQGAETTECADREIRRVEHLGRRLAIPAADGKRTVRVDVREVVAERFSCVEVALGERVRAARQGRQAVDHGHDHEVVLVGRALDEAAGLVVIDRDARSGVDVAAVIGELAPHQAGHTTVHFDRVDARGAVDERVLDIDPAARPDDEHMRSRHELVGCCDDGRPQALHVTRPVQHLRRRVQIEIHHVRIRPRPGVVRRHQEAIEDAGLLIAVMDGVDARVRVPPRSEMRDHTAVDPGLVRSGLRRSDRVTGDRQGDHRRHGAGCCDRETESRPTHSERGSRSEHR